MDVKASYSRLETAECTFHSANPRNNQRPENTFLAVEKKDVVTGAFDIVKLDGDWDTKFKWQAGRDDKYALGLSAISYATLSWTISSDEEPGVYRICHQGNHKQAVTAAIVPFQGCSSEFEVVA